MLVLKVFPFLFLFLFFVSYKVQIKFTYHMPINVILTSIFLSSLRIVCSAMHVAIIVVIIISLFPPPQYVKK
jgi:hypothetical protein